MIFSKLGAEYFILGLFIGIIIIILFVCGYYFIINLLLIPKDIYKIDKMQQEKK